MFNEICVWQVFHNMWIGKTLHFIIKVLRNSKAERRVCMFYVTLLRCRFLTRKRSRSWEDKRFYAGDELRRITSHMYVQYLALRLRSVPNRLWTFAEWKMWIRLKKTHSKSHVLPHKRNRSKLNHTAKKRWVFRNFVLVFHQAQLLFTQFWHDSKSMPKRQTSRDTPRVVGRRDALIQKRH